MYKSAIVEQLPTPDLAFKISFVELAGSGSFFVMRHDTLLVLEGDRAHREPLRYRSITHPSRTRGGHELRLYSCSADEAELAAREFADVVLSAGRQFSVLRAGSARIALTATGGLRTPIQYGVWALRDHLEAVAVGLGLPADSITMVSDFSEVGEMRAGVVQRPDGTDVLYSHISDIPEGCFYTNNYARGGGLLRAMMPGSTGTWLIRVAEIQNDESRFTAPYRMYLHKKVRDLHGEEADQEIRRIAYAICAELGIDPSRLDQYRDSINTVAKTCGPPLAWRSDDDNLRLRRILDTEPTYEDFNTLSEGVVSRLYNELEEACYAAGKLRGQRLENGSIQLVDVDYPDRVAAVMSLTSKGVSVYYPSGKVGRRYYLVRSKADVRNTSLRIHKMLK